MLRVSYLVYQRKYPTLVPQGTLSKRIVTSYLSWVIGGSQELMRTMEPARRLITRCHPRLTLS